MVKIFNFDNETIDNNEFSSNSYVIGEQNGPCIIVDLGSTNKRIIDYIKKNHTSVLGILLTHGHFDHIRGLNNFLKEFNATIFIYETENEFLLNSRLNRSKNHAEDVVVETENIYLVDDEDEINFGNQIYVKVIHTPFHTSGSVCFLIKSENALFTGDTLFKGFIGRTDLPTGNEKEVYSSLSKIKQLNENYTIYPGHGEITTLFNELKNNYYLKKEN